MNKIFFWTGLLSLGFSVHAQKYEFNPVLDIKSFPVISQGQTGTCWSYATSSFLESEIMKISGKSIDLSEMYNVRHTYFSKAYNYIMRQGKAQFDEGGLSHDVINSAKKHGLVPLSVYNGLKNQEEKHDHKKLVEELKEVVNKYTDPDQKLDPKWKKEVNDILDLHLGKDVTEFVFEGKSYTPKTFLQMTGLNLNDYITLTSFTHEPYYERFVLAVPDNFSNESFYNLPLDEFVQNIDYALENGYTLSYDADVTETTFSAKNGLAVLPEHEADLILAKTEIVTEKIVTPEFRQQEFENFNTTDDHLMHIVGKVKDQKGNFYYKVKNSWGSENVGNDGYLYMSVPYIKMKSISVLVHKNALTKNTKKKLNIK